MAPQTLPPQPGRFVTVGVLMLASLTIMANATIAPALPGLRAQFADVEGIDTLAGLLLSLPSLAIMLSAGVFGWLADRVSRQMLLIVAAAAVAIGGGSGLVVDTLPAMLAGRIVLGIGVAGTMALALVWGADIWQGPARARFMGLQGATMSGGGVVIMLLGGALAALHWRGAFAAYLLVIPVAIVAYMALAPYARARKDAPKETETAEGAFPWGAFALVGPLAFIFMAAFYIMPTRLPFLLTGLGVENPAVIGGIMALMTAVSVPGALAYGRIRQRFTAMAVFSGSFLAMGAGLVVVGLAPSVPLVLVGIVLMGLGMGPSMPNYTTYFMAHTPAALRGRAAGMLTTAFFAGQFVSPLLSAPLVAGFGLSGAFEVLGGALVVLGTGLAVAAARSRHQRAPATP